MLGLLSRPGCSYGLKALGERGKIEEDCSRNLTGKRKMAVITINGRQTTPINDEVLHAMKYYTSTTEFNCGIDQWPAAAASPNQRGKQRALVAPSKFHTLSTGHCLPRIFVRPRCHGNLLSGSLSKNSRSILRTGNPFVV